MNQQTLQGHWKEIRGQIREHWGQLTDDDLARSKGNLDQLVGTIQQKTGEARESIERYLDQIAEDSKSGLNKAGEAVSDLVDKATETVQAGSKRAAEVAREYYDQTGKLVKRRPVESLVACFCTGLITGVVLSLALRR